MNSLITFMWYQGGRNVFSATSQRSQKTTKSIFAVPGVSDGEVSTVKIEGSAWSNKIGHRRISTQVIFVWVVVSVPRDHIERRALKVRHPERSTPFCIHA